MKQQIWSIAMVLNLAVATMYCSAAETITLENDVIRAELTAKGLSQMVCTGRILGRCHTVVDGGAQTRTSLGVGVVVGVYKDE